MRWLGLLFGLAWVVVGWRNLPPLGERSALAAGVAIGVTCWLSWYAGKATTRASATAIANARADARAAAVAASSSSSQAVGSQVVIVGAGGASPEVLSGLDAAPWIAGARGGQIDQDLVESLSLDVGEDLDQVEEIEQC